MIQVNRAKIDQSVIDEYHPLNTEDKPLYESQADLVRALESDPNSEIDARVITVDPASSKVGMKRVGKAEFIESSKLPDAIFEGVKLREGIDSYSTDVGDLPNTGFVGGEDFVPLLGGAFYRQLYQLDYIKQANAAFYAYNHDPLAHASVNILSDFTLGRGYRVDSDNAAALALWRSFEKVNRLPEQMLQVSKEIAIYGESMFWWLPNNNTKIIQRPYAEQVIPKGLIPRIRLIDPTNIYEVVTEPEDITSALFYVWLAPTQYQVYSGLEKNINVPTAKFIFQQIPADQIDHYKINSVSNEKRGRSDLFPVMGYLKRLRDSVNYSIIALQKQSAFCIDTIVKGSQTDIQNYIEDQQSYGTIAPAGSEFVHTDAIERKYMGPEGSKGGHSTAFEWAFSMFCAGIGIPTSYFGTHLSGGQTRASAIVATEPVAKRFEQRQLVFERMIQDQWDRLMKWAGLGLVECEITFPDLITQDRSQKLKDLALAESQRWLSNKTAGTIAGKEFGITSYEWDLEQNEIDQEHAEGIEIAPLTSPGMSSAPPTDSAPQAVTGTEKKAIKSYG